MMAPLSKERESPSLVGYANVFRRLTAPHVVKTAS